MILILFIIKRYYYWNWCDQHTSSLIAYMRHKKKETLLLYFFWGDDDSTKDTFTVGPCTTRLAFSRLTLSIRKLLRTSTRKYLSPQESKITINSWRIAYVEGHTNLLYWRTTSNDIYTDYNMNELDDTDVTIQQITNWLTTLFPIYLHHDNPTPKIRLLCNIIEFENKQILYDSGIASGIASGTASGINSDSCKTRNTTGSSNP